MTTSPYRKATAEKLVVMQHYANGGEVEFKEHGSALWKPASTPQWNWSTTDFRVAGDVQLGPWDVATAPMVPFTVMSLSSGAYYTVVSKSSNGVYIPGVGYGTYDELFTQYEHVIGSGVHEPCGVEV